MVAIVTYLASGWKRLYVREDCISATACSEEVNYSWIPWCVYVGVMCYVQRYIYIRAVGTSGTALLRHNNNIYIKNKILLRY